MTVNDERTRSVAFESDFDTYSPELVKQFEILMDRTDFVDDVLDLLDNKLLQGGRVVTVSEKPAPLGNVHITITPFEPEPEIIVTDEKVFVAPLYKVSVSFLWPRVSFTVNNLERTVIRTDIENIEELRTLVLSYAYPFIFNRVQYFQLLFLVPPHLLYIT